MFADFVVANKMLEPWLGQSANRYLIQYSFFAISFLAVISHARTMLTDPGAVPLEYQPNALVSASAAAQAALRSLRPPHRLHYALLHAHPATI